MTYSSELIRVSLAPGVVVHHLDDLTELHDERTGLILEIDEIQWDLDSQQLMIDQETEELLVLAGLLLGYHGDERSLELRQQDFCNLTLMKAREEQLKESLKLCYSQVPYYRDRGDNVERLLAAPLDFIPQLAPIDKKILRKHFTELLNENSQLGKGLEQGRYELVTTSGSTGDQLQAICDYNIARIPENYEVLWGITFNGNIPDTAVVTSPHCTRIGCGDQGLNKTHINDEYTHYIHASRDLFHTSENEIKTILEQILATKAEIIFCNPVYLHWLCREASRLQLRLPKPRLVLTSFQYISQIQQAALEKYLRCPVYNIYSATELGGCQIAVQCAEGHWHLREDHCYIEIEPEPDYHDHYGNILVTTLNNEVMPLVRYRLGDLARTLETNCSLSHWQIIEFHGREVERLFNNESSMSTKQVDDILSLSHEIDFYCCEQISLSDIQINVILKPDAIVDNDFTKIKDRFSAFGFNASIVITDALQPAPSLKYPLCNRLI